MKASLWMITLGGVSKAKGVIPGRVMPMTLGNEWGNLRFQREVRSSAGQYMFTGTHQAAAGANFDGVRMELRQGENVISVMAKGTGKFDWGNGEKAFKLEVNGIPCQPESQYLAAGDGNDPYAKVDKDWHIIDYVLPRAVVESGVITKMQVVVGAGSNIKLTLLQPRLKKIEGLVPPDNSPRIESPNALPLGSVEAGNLIPLLVNTWGTPGLINKVTQEEGQVKYESLVFKGDNPGASGVNFDGQNISLSPGGKVLYLVLENRQADGPTVWNWGGVVKVEVNDKPLIPIQSADSESIITSAQDPYLKPFDGTTYICYPLSNIAAINKLQLVIGAGNNINMVIHQIDIMQVPSA